jgi:ketosteroid isomerase-like protein
MVYQCSHTNKQEEIMNSTSNQKEIKKEILGLERKYWDAMRNKDVDAAVEMTKFPCILTSPKGAQRIEEKEYRDMMNSMKVDTFKGVEIENAEVNFLNKDTALISYSIKYNGMDMLDVSTWVRENGKWTCAFHSENPISDKH